MQKCLHNLALKFFVFQLWTMNKQQGAFEAAKASYLAKTDASRKGSWDEATKDFMIRLNEHNDLVTLSSCSGRVVILRDKPRDAGKVVKKGCVWILVKHDALKEDEVWNSLHQSEPEAGIVTLKFEPFILHLQCRTLELAKRMHTIR